jgi:Holliday junction resolvase RusA-like endonuclease
MAYPKPVFNSTSKSFSLTIDGRPRARARPRFVAGKPPYNDKDNEAEKDRISLLAKTRMALLGIEKPYEGPVSVTIEAFFRPPKPAGPKDRERLVRMRNGDVKQSNLPDIDNIAKMILDAFNEIVWEDDRRVWELIVRKRYTPTAGEFPDGMVKVTVVPDRFG